MSRKAVRKYRASKARKKKENKEKFLKSKAKSLIEKKTWPELEFEKLMNELGVSFKDQKIVDNKIYDYYLEDYNTLVEVHGDYWHANPLIYEGKKLNKIQERNKRNDVKKLALAKDSGYKIYIIWEKDLKENYSSQKQRFKRNLKL